MPSLPSLVDKRILRPAETAVALGLTSDIELLRLKTIARLYARGLPPDVSWEDLLQEALTRVLIGSRRQPPDVPMLPFLAGVMKSLKAEHWRRVLNGYGHGKRRHIAIPGNERAMDVEDPAPGPERSLSAQQELTAIERLFADDVVALKIIHGLAGGHSAEQIRVSAGISKIDYDSARRRMRRVLLREGLTCEPK